MFSSLAQAFRRRFTLTHCVVLAEEAKNTQSNTKLTAVHLIVQEYQGVCTFFGTVTTYNAATAYETVRTIHRQTLPFTTRVWLSRKRREKIGEKIRLHVYGHDMYDRPPKLEWIPISSCTYHTEKEVAWTAS